MSVVALKVAVDPDLCIGTGNCVYWAPETFEMGDDGQAHTLTPEPDAVKKDEVVHAALQCPIRAVRVWQDDELIV